MTENHSASRRRAEMAFADIHTKASARDRAFEEIEMIKAAREEKTLKLREARLAKEEQGKAPEKTPPASRRPRP
ncbi:hypothetical protein GIY56_14275 [Paracoccus sp. YIM 132242]|uniref:Uncharacterized protein n=1 Tax=Paracoccus lichenicola TaxID=2665644 RepID=A0A6L6HT71_9RHOB|nr:hypothetical protein [Paracoccus lichenicola]MTE01451.1 hypothetical protein [Paracoccus lichenicola]